LTKRNYQRPEGKRDRASPAKPAEPSGNMPIGKKENKTGSQLEPRRGSTRKTVKESSEEKA